MLATILLALFPPADGWQPYATRDEIRPVFGRTDAGGLVITHDARPGLDGAWRKDFAVTGGKSYRFAARRQTSHVSTPRRSAVVRIAWLGGDGKSVREDRPLVPGYLAGDGWPAEDEYPLDAETDATGRTLVRGEFTAPARAVTARVSLHLCWAPSGRVEWSDVTFADSTPPKPRTVILATVHHRPKGGTAATKCEQFAPLVAEAARKGADFVVLPETLTYYDSRLSPVEVAEPIPGPSSNYFAELAKKHNLYIVAGLYERSGHLIYNVAVLLGPDGTVVGKYRKVTLPTGEVARGVCPGDEYPVFPTRFGKVGLMVCYDGFFPEVARRVAANGAEVIAWPVWGCNPHLAAARAAENHVHLVSSTYEDVSTNWMISAVYDPTGKTVAQAKEWGTVATATVDLAARPRWRSLGDFGAKVHRHRPE